VIFVTRYSYYFGKFRSNGILKRICAKRYVDDHSNVFVVVKIAWYPEIICRASRQEVWRSATTSLMHDTRYTMQEWSSQ